MGQTASGTLGWVGSGAVGREVGAPMAAGPMGRLVPVWALVRLRRCRGWCRCGVWGMWWSPTGDVRHALTASKPAGRGRR